jgi:putative intracellular protease/amidase
MKSIAIVIPPDVVDLHQLQTCLDTWSGQFYVSVISTHTDTLTLEEVSQVLTPLLLGQIDEINFDGIAVLGGGGKVNSLWDHPPLTAKLQSFDAARKLVAGIGEGSMTLAQAGLLLGKKATINDDPSAIEGLRSYGAIYDPSDVVAIAWIVTGSGADVQQFADTVAAFVAQN